MNVLELTLPTPAENLACDEALLDAAEAGEIGEVLRFWEPHQHFVVLGYANKVATEVNVSACESRGVPILRRCSGGGTVLQGPGCLNYTLVLKIQANEWLQSIAAANRFIMERHRKALEGLLQRPVAIEGHTDLAVDGCKFSGNSQRRRRRFLLFHGTCLMNFDIALIEALLPPPTKQPDYRQERTHTDFLTNLRLPAPAIQAALVQAWSAIALRPDLPEARIETLVSGKYATRAWSFRF